MRQCDKGQKWRINYYHAGGGCVLTGTWNIRPTLCSFVTASQSLNHEQSFRRIIHMLEGFLDGCSEGLSKWLPSLVERDERGFVHKEAVRPVGM